MSGRRLVAYGLAAVAAAAILLLLVLRLASDPNVKANLGSDVFDVGRTARLATEIRRHGPVLFPDPTGHGRDVVIDHVGAEIDRGWYARRPGSGDVFPTRVENGHLIVDIRAGPPAHAPASAGEQ